MDIVDLVRFLSEQFVVFGFVILYATLFVIAGLWFNKTRNKARKSLFLAMTFLFFVILFLLIHFVNPIIEALL